MDETPDPRVKFARRLQALREAAGLSIRRLEVESERTPRRRKEDAIRLKRSTIAGMTNRERPVRPELANFEVFVDTCLRVATENNIPLPPGLGDPLAWDEAYRELRDQVDRYPRRAVIRTPVESFSLSPTPVVPPVPGPPVLPASPAEPILPAWPAGRGDVAEPERRLLLSRRTILLAAPAALAVAGAGVAIPLLRRGTRSPSPGRSPSPAGLNTDAGYSPVGRLLSPPVAQDDPVWAVAIGMLRGEPLAVVGRGDGTVQLWNPATGRAYGAPLGGHDKPVFSVALSGPVAVSASVDGTLRVWDLTADPPTSTRLGDRLGGGINSVVLATVNGRTVAVSAGDDCTVRIWDPAAPAATGRVLGTPLDSAVNSVAVGTLQGMTIAVSGSTDGTVRLWDVGGERLVRSLGAHDAMVGAMAIGTVRGRTLAVSGGEDGQVRSWDLAAAQPTGVTLSRINDAVKTVSIGTVNGRTVAVSGNDDNTIRIWDLATGRSYGNGLAGPDKGAESLAISNLAGRTTVVSGHWDGTIWTWSL